MSDGQGLDPGTGSSPDSSPEPEPPQPFFEDAPDPFTPPPVMPVAPEVSGPPPLWGGPPAQPWDATADSPWGPPGYGHSSPRPRSTNGYAIASLCCGIAGLLTGIAGLLGIIFGVIALRSIRRDGQEGRGLAIAGIVIGAATLALAIVLVLLFLAGRPIGPAGNPAL